MKTPSAIFILLALLLSGCVAPVKSVDIVIDTNEPRPGEVDFAWLIATQKHKVQEPPAGATTAGGNNRR